MMALKMLNPFGSVTDSIPGVGGGDKDEGDGQTKEEQQEQERLRQEAIKDAERNRRVKYQKQETEREGVREGIRSKYGIEKKVNEEEEEEDDDDDDGFGSTKKVQAPDDPVAQAKAMAEAQLKAAQEKAKDCVIQ